jgi:hypothetical protein
MSLFLLFLSGCNGCRPSLPSNQDTEQHDTHDTTDSQDSTPPEDTSPELPPHCDVMEVEPNDQLSQVVEIPTEKWVCGLMMPADPEHAPLGDVDFLHFATTEPGWVEVNLEAARRGSSADMQFVLYDDDDSITVTDSYLSTDPIIRFPTTEAGDYTVVLGESSFLFGDDYAWYLLASIVKPPVEWSFNEVEPNDTFGQATPFAPGETVYGTIERVGDFDWYHLVTPAEATTIRFTMNAFLYGSPMDGEIMLYDTDGTTLLRDDRQGEIEYDLDPWFEQKQTEAHDWYVLVRNEQERGSRFNWYTLTIEALTE